MLRGDQYKERGLRGAPANRLVIRCPSSRPGSGRERTLIYVSRGIPPITSAEVEIMHEHLEQSARAASADAQNDNE